MDLRPRRLALAAVACGSIATAACADEGDRLRVQICGDLRVGAQIDAIRISVRAPDHEALAYSGVDELVEAIDAGVDAGADASPAPESCAVGAEALALSFDLPPVEARSWVQVQGLWRGAERISVEARVDEVASEVLVGLTAACLGVACPLGQTCLSGACGVVPFGGTRSACVADCPFGAGSQDGGGQEGEEATR